MLAPTTRLYYGLVLFSLAGSLLSKLTGLSPGPIAPIAGLLTIASGCWAMFGSEWKPGKFRLITVLIFGGFIEVVGLVTYFPFGRYTYTVNWWPSIQLPLAGRFPLLLPFAWLMLAGGSWLVVSRFKKVPVWGRVGLAAALATLIDLVMEPVMVQSLDYWRWDPKGPLPGGAPWMNVFGWFATSLVAALILSRSPRDDAPCQAGWVLAGHLVLTTGIGMIKAL